MKPRVRALSKRKTRTKHGRMPKLIRIGDSVGLIISKAMLRSIGWQKGDYIAIEYIDKDDELGIRNFTANQRRHK